MMKANPIFPPSVQTCFCLVILALERIFILKQIYYSKCGSTMISLYFGKQNYARQIFPSSILCAVRSRQFYVLPSCGFIMAQVKPTFNEKYKKNVYFQNTSHL